MRLHLYDIQQNTADIAAALRHSSTCIQAICLSFGTDMYEAREQQLRALLLSQVDDPDSIGVAPLLWLRMQRHYVSQRTKAQIGHCQQAAPCVASHCHFMGRPAKSAKKVQVNRTPCLFTYRVAGLTEVSTLQMYISMTQTMLTSLVCCSAPGRWTGHRSWRRGACGRRCRTLC